MLISSKGRYALRLMVALAQTADGTDAVALRRVSASEGISLKYLEQLAHSLVGAGLLSSTRGREGGYAFARPAADITAGDVIRAVEGAAPAVSCSALEEGCPRESICSVADFWAGLDDAIDAYVDGITLADLVGDDVNRRPFQTLS